MDYRPQIKGHTEKIDYFEQSLEAKNLITRKVVIEDILKIID